ncbi:hypothetical protein [Herbaspirillum sp. RV1423]|uniref:hypothetical protein n=1 Tax=Herbaspirillum sp. RV1423 TaxID=1443993 RepID=UPI0012DE8A3C|nr:hypothetical protein [Herbaspirillum sp. RV1423]
MHEINSVGMGRGVDGIHHGGGRGGSPASFFDAPCGCRDFLDLIDIVVRSEFPALPEITYPTSKLNHDAAWLQAMIRRVFGI